MRQSHRNPKRPQSGRKRQLPVLVKPAIVGAVERSTELKVLHSSPFSFKGPAICPFIPSAGLSGVKPLVIPMRGQTPGEVQSYWYSRWPLVTVTANSSLIDTPLQRATVLATSPRYAGVFTSLFRSTGI